MAALGPDVAGAAGFGVGAVVGVFGVGALATGLATGFGAVAPAVDFEADGLNAGLFVVAVVVADFAARREAAAGFVTGAVARAIGEGADAGEVGAFAASPGFGLGSLTLK